jgi:hypothetical protein
MSSSLRSCSLLRLCLHHWRAYRCRGRKLPSCAPPRFPLEPHLTTSAHLLSLQCDVLGSMPKSRIPSCMGQLSSSVTIEVEHLSTALLGRHPRLRRFNPLSQIFVQYLPSNSAKLAFNAVSPVLDFSMEEKLAEINLSPPRFLSHAIFLRLTDHCLEFSHTEMYIHGH